MCGIIGLYKKHLSEKEDAFFNNALNVIAHRGPDNKGIFRFNDLLLGHRRLSIIDTTESANQPFFDETNNYVLIFNGEIFNYKALRNDLQSKGVTINTNSDTEVLLHLLIREGEKAIKKLNGFFSFAFFDKTKNNLLLARDRYGVKPLVYYLDENIFCFGSELKALMACGIPKKLNHKILSTYFHLNYIPHPHTIFEGVYKLPPAYFLKFDINSGKLEIDKYYSLPDLQKPSTNVSYDEAKTEIRNLLDDSVRLRLVSDVPIGTFLSGGIDSSITTALASKHVNKLNSFSIGFKDEPFFDETKYAQILAKKYKTEHTIFNISNNDLFEHLNQVLYCFDEPFADSSALNVYLLSKYTKQHVTVALSGDGADELFSGYNKHTALLRASQSNIQNTILKSGGTLLNNLPQSRNGKFANKIRQLSKYSNGLQYNAQDRYWNWAGFYSNDVNILKQKYPDIRNEFISGITGNFNSVLAADFNLVLSNDMLAKVDLMSMANSLEVRTPFLDYRLVDYVFKLPANYKIDSVRKKKILIDSFSDILPQELSNRPKQGFEVPLLKWFIGQLRSEIENNWLNKDFIIEQNLFNLNEIELLKRKLYSSNPGDAVAKMWGLIVFQQWYKNYFL